MEVLSNLKFKGSGPVLESLTNFPTNPDSGQMCLVDGCVYIFTAVNNIETWYPLTNKNMSYIHTQGVSALEWTISHSLNSDNFIFFIYDENDNLIEANYSVIDSNSFKLTFTLAKKGKVVVFAAVENNALSMSSDNLKVKNIINGFTDLSAFNLLPDGSIEFNGNLVPSLANTYSIGTPTNPVSDLYVGANSLYVNGQKVLSNNNNSMDFTADIGQSIGIQTSGTGSINIQTTGDGDIELNPSGTGNIQVKGILQINAGEKITSSDGSAININEDLSVNGSITSIGDIISGGVNLTNAIATSHQHNNLSILENIGESVDNKLTFNGNSVDTVIAQRDVYNGLDSIDTSISLSAAQGKILNDKINATIDGGSY